MLPMDDSSSPPRQAPRARTPDEFRPSTAERRLPPRPRTEQGPRPAPPAVVVRRPTTPVLDVGFSRARAALRRRARARAASQPKLRPPGALPRGAGIGLDASVLPQLTQSYIDQYVRASLAVIRRHDDESREARRRHSEDVVLAAGARALAMCDVVDDAMDAAAALIVPGADRTIVRGGKAPDIFERAEHPDVASLPLLSQVARRGPKAMPMVSKDARESTSQANVFKGRLHAMARLARDDAVLARVTLCNEGIDDDWAAALADALGFNSRLEQLVAVGNFITDVGGVRLAHAAALHPALQALCLGGNALGDETAVAAAETLQKCTTLQCLNLSAQKHHRNHLVGHVRTHRRDELDKAYKRGGIANKLSLKERLGRAGSMVVEYVPPAALEGAPKTLVARDAAPARATVRLEGDAAAATTLLAAARAAPSSRGDMLTLRGADILTLRDGGGDDGDVSSAESDASDSDSASGAFSVSAFEAKTWGRRPLGCEFCGAITSRGIEALAAQLPKCNLTELDLSGQRAKNAGALSIAQAIETGSRIVFLALDSNGIGDAGVSALATAFLAPLSRMRVLSLRQNRATDVAALAISDLLPHATHTATSLDLSMNAIGKEGCFALAESSECGAVVHINVSANPGAEFRRDKSRLELLRQMRASSSFSKRGGVSRPIRLCTAQADSGRNLLHLRKSAGEGPGGPTDSLLRDMQRAATARSNREARGRMPAQLDRKAKKLAKHSQKAYEAKAHLPPLSFAATQSAMVRHAAAARDAPHGARDTLSASRVGRFVAKEFGGVASVKGALHGRLDLAARKPKAIEGASLRFAGTLQDSLR